MGNDSVRSDRSLRHRSKVIDTRIEAKMLRSAPMNESFLPVQVAWPYGWHWPGSSALGGTLLHYVAGLGVDKGVCSHIS